MQIPRILPLLCLSLCASTIAANFATFDTTVQVKTYTQKATDSTIIKLRNTGFTLSYTLSLSGICPTLGTTGDFELRPDTNWIFQTSEDKGDSLGKPQSIVVYYCDFQQYFPEILIAGGKYREHIYWLKSDGSSDTIYTMVKKVVNDSTFTLTVSAKDFALTTTAIQSKSRDLAKSSLKNNYTPDGRRISSSSKIWIDSRGNKIINLHR